jgi:hypothetical protein
LTEALVLSQFLEIMLPLTRTKRWTTSRIGLLPDRSLRPILDTLALEKYGHYDRDTWQAYYRDKNWANEVYANVDLMLKRGSIYTKHSMFPGVPSGTPEYWRRYRELNRETVNKYHKAAAARHRSKMKRIEEQTEADVAALLNGTADVVQDPGGTPLEVEDLLKDLG